MHAFVKRFVRKASDLDVNDVLEAVGLSRRRSTASLILSAIGLLALGGAVGAGVGLMFAPASGERTRRDVERKISSLAEKLPKRIVHPSNGVEATLPVT